MIKTNFHTHTYYCDGKDSPEEMVLAAIDKGFTSIGFSSHSYLEKDAQYVMSRESAEKYRNEIHSLKEKYKDKIKIFCGIEQDYYSQTPTDVYDYVIGSVHNVLKNGEFLIVDGSVDEMTRQLECYYQNDFDAFAEDYFSLIKDVVVKTNADIIGHFDLVLKNCERIPYKPTKRFLTAAERAVKELVKYQKPFEINTGAMARGYRTAPYPLPEILKMIYENNGSIIFSSDCHDKSKLDFGFDVSKPLALEIGFKKQAIITENKIEYVDII